MAGRGDSCYWLLLLRVVVASLVLNSSSCSRQYRICKFLCCSLNPSSSLHVVCECPDLDSMTIHKGDMPASATSITISGPVQLTFQKHAFYGLPSLVALNVDLRHEGKLNVAEYGLAFQRQSKLFFLTIENAKAVVLANSAFAGIWNPDSGAKIKVQNVERLQIQQNGISFRSTRYGPGPNLIMDYVRELVMDSNALNATIRSLTMSNVHMLTCLDKSFGGQISEIEMNHVKINQVHEGCIKASNMSKLSIVDCDMERIQLQGFFGNIREVEIKNSHVINIEPYGFALQVTSLRIKNCLISDLMENGLNVTANDSIKLERVNITTLRRHALASLTSLQQVMDFQDVNITHVVQGSLAFSKGTELRITGKLGISVSDPSMCPTTKKRIHWLVGKPENEKLTDADNKLRSQLQRFCPDTDTVDLSQKRTETGNSGSQLGDEGMSTPRTTHEADGSHEIGYTNTPEDETTTHPKVTSSGDAHATPSREPEMTGSCSTTWNVLLGVVTAAFMVGLVMGVIFANPVKALAKQMCTKLNTTGESQPDDLCGERKKLQDRRERSPSPEAPRPASGVKTY